MDSGLSFDASSEVCGGEDLDRAVGNGKVKGGSGSVLGDGIKRAEPQRERDGGDSFLATTDSIRQQHRTAFCALKHTRSSCKPAIYYVDVQRVVVRCFFGSVWGGGLGPCGWRGQGQENREVHLVFVVFGRRKHRFTLLSG